MSIIGRLTSGLDVERATLVALRDRLPKYLKEAAKQASVKPEEIAEIEEVKSWAVISEYDRWPETNLPAIIIAAPGLRGEPVKGGDGSYRVKWTLGVSIVVSAATAPKARKYAQIYAAAVRGAILQARSMGKDLRVSDWIDEVYETTKREGRKTTVAATVVFVVDQSDVVNWRGGPATDEELPEVIPEDFPEVTEIDVESEIKP
ncbi:MAG TPA: hypothetical protein VMS60_15885 [Solirubrobacterales bacterium]|nr:hypothetical protein [Solirubrobacterales bacterium]